MRIEALSDSDRAEKDRVVQLLDQLGWNASAWNAKLMQGHNMRPVGHGQVLLPEYNLVMEYHLPLRYIGLYVAERSTFRYVKYRLYPADTMDALITAVSNAKQNLSVTSPQSWMPAIAKHCSKIEEEDHEEKTVDKSSVFGVQTVSTTKKSTEQVAKPVATEVVQSTPGNVVSEVTQSDGTLWYGVTEELPVTGNFSPNFLLGTGIDVPQECTLRGLGVLIRRAAGQMRLALYDDNGNRPGRCLAFSEPITCEAKRMVWQCASPVRLTSGKYWFMAVYSVSCGPAEDKMETKIRPPLWYIPLPFNSEIPAIFPENATTYNSSRKCYWIVVEP